MNGFREHLENPRIYDHNFLCMIRVEAVNSNSGPLWCLEGKKFQYEISVWIWASDNIQGTSWLE